MNVPDRLELIDDIPLVINSSQSRKSKGGVLETERDLAGLLVEVEFQDTIGVADIASENVDSPYSIVDELRVYGRSKIRHKREDFYVLRGPDIRQSALLNTGRTPYSTGAVGVAQAQSKGGFICPFGSRWRATICRLPIAQSSCSPARTMMA